MIDLFFKDNTIAYKSLTPPDTGNTYGRINMYLESVVGWFKRSNYFVPNENVLVGVVSTLGIDYTWSIPNIIKHVENNVRNVTRTMGISNEFYIDVVPELNGIVKNSTEIIYINNKTNIVNSRNIDITNWTKMEPLRFRNHEFSDLYFNHPSRIVDAKGSLIVYDLDMVGLMIMFKFYVNDRVSNNLNYSIAEFIGSYVLANSIYSLADIAILNNYLDKGNIFLQPKQYVSTTMVSMNATRLDRIVDLSILNTDNQSLMEVLRNIKLIYRKDAFEELLLKNYYETSRSKIYVILTLLDFIRNILKYIDINSRDNAMYIRNLKYQINAFRNANTYTNNVVVNKKVKKVLADIYYKIQGDWQ